jgi:hypothetical protein
VISANWARLQEKREPVSGGSREIADFLRRSPILRPVLVSPRMVAPIHRQPYPTVESMARELLEDSEFRALRLADWLRSPDGQLIAEAVSLVIPADGRLEYELAVEALRLAAELQPEQGAVQRWAGLVALIGVAALGIGVLGPALRSPRRPA